MYKELFCKYKNRTVILNEFNVDCICAHCHQENCNSVKTLNIMNDCQERIILKIKDNYRMAKAYRCRLCACMSRNIKQNEPTHEIIRAHSAHTR